MKFLLGFCFIVPPFYFHLILAFILCHSLLLLQVLVVIALYCPPRVATPPSCIASCKSICTSSKLLLRLKIFVWNSIVLSSQNSLYNFMSFISFGKKVVSLSWTCHIWWIFSLASSKYPMFIFWNGFFMVASTTSCMHDTKWWWNLTPSPLT